MKVHKDKGDAAMEEELLIKGVMHKERMIKDDGRYLIFYRFARAEAPRAQSSGLGWSGSPAEAEDSNSGRRR